MMPAYLWTGKEKKKKSLFRKVNKKAHLPLKEKVEGKNLAFVSLFEH